MGQFIGSHKPDGYNTEEELDEMGLIGRHDPDFGEVKCGCECCMDRRKADETQEEKDNLARLELKLRLKAQGKKDEDQYTIGKLAGTDWNTDLANEVWQKAKYTGPKHSDLRMIRNSYPCHEIIVEMYGGPVFTINTDQLGAEIVYKCFNSLDDYAKAHGLRDYEMDDVHRAYDIVVPGAKRVYYMEM